MLKYKTKSLALCLTATLATCACGSSDSDDGGGASGSGSAGRGPMIGLGGSTGVPGGGAGGGATFDGGKLPLTPQEVTQIRGDACAGWSIEGEALPAVMQLVVDVSSSMNQTPRGARETKWESTREALLEAVVGVDGSGLPASVGLGMLFYPNVPSSTPSAQPRNISACVNVDAMVPIALLGGETAAQRTLVRTSIERVQLASSTPTHDAYRHALQNALLTTRLSGQRYMLLITDGEPTLSLGCVNGTGSLNAVDPAPIVQEITAAAAQGIKTFLIGSPGSENNRRWMSRAAVIGGTALAGCREDGPNYCHMDMTQSADFSQALRDGLADVAGQIAPCSYAFPPPPSGQVLDTNKVNLIVKSGSQSSLVLRDDVGDCTQGWQLNANQEVVLCPQTCAEVQADASMSVELVFGCGSVPTPPR
ncbi:MAG TPA: vWA domain-containing protein [Polyangiaceae bacterium]|nr:vWA domain-containing protein [Polyangiaceae bacterium]